MTDPSWDVVPVVNPDLPARKRDKLFDRVVLTDPVGVAEPVHQDRDREHVVVPSSLDQQSRELLLRTQKAIAVAIDGEAAIAAGGDGVVPGSTLLLHEWEIALALRDVSDLRAEHGLNASVSAGPMTNAVLKSYRDWQDALRISGLNDMYLDLVARTAADEYAVAEISGMTEQAATAGCDHGRHAQAAQQPHRRPGDGAPVPEASPIVVPAMVPGHHQSPDAGPSQDAGGARVVRAGEAGPVRLCVAAGREAREDMPVSDGTHRRGWT